MPRKDLNEYIRKNYEKKSDAVIASEFGINENAVRMRRQRMGLKRAVNDYGELVNKDIALQRYRDESQTKDKKYKALIDQLTAKDKEIDALLALKDNINEFIIRPSGKSETSEATAIWLASDWHVGERVTYGQTNNLNEYNPNIATKRAEAFFRNGLRLTKMTGQDTQIKTIVLALLGDFITGHLHLDAVETNYLPPVEETIYAQNLIVSGINFILKNSKYDVIIPCHSGNHGRTTKFSHFGSENGHSLEYFMYSSIANYFRTEPRVKVMVAEGSHSYLDIYGHVVRFLHGHDIKYGGGVGGIFVPVNKAISQWDKSRPAALTCFGHFHQRLDGQAFLANGSLIGYNAFALSIKASAERPVQQFALIDRVKGKTIVAPIFLDE